ncbi:MAG: hypothetical protein C5B50_02890 [Verrucomicrobia bacterium]|nr:MAG: hypothetical protein C5B50_02890 [Verrucomicrobiota bacterium]
MFAAGLLIVTTCARAQFSDTISARSFSGQFVVSAPRVSLTPHYVTDLLTNPSLIRLDPMLLPASCERIKQALCRELGAVSSWSGGICIKLQPASSPDDLVTISSDYFRDGWKYQVLMPEVVDRNRFTRAIVRVSLQEMANRGATAHGADVPAWLVEGFSRRLLAFSEAALILPSPRAAPNGLRLSSMLVDERHKKPLEKVHASLCANTPFTFEELSWPSPDQTAEQEDLFANSSYFFVNQLLLFPDGRACFRAMLDELSQHYNWQLSFLHAFQAYFHQPLDVEKWWSLQVARFTGRDFSQASAVQDSWRKLDQILVSGLQVRMPSDDAPDLAITNLESSDLVVGTNSSNGPLHTEVSLQKLIQRWETEPHPPPLDSKLRELEMFRFQAAPDQLVLVDEYRRTLQEYLRDREKRGLLPFHQKATRRKAADAAIRQLDLLDARRAALEYIHQNLTAPHAPADAQAAQAAR